jgi:hypothetical protein
MLRKDQAYRLHPCQARLSRFMVAATILCGPP